jgi:hypothetical protein
MTTVEEKRNILAECGVLDLYDQFWAVYDPPWWNPENAAERDRRYEERGRVVGRILRRIDPAFWYTDNEGANPFDNEVTESLYGELFAELWYGLDEGLMLETIEEMIRQLHLVRDGYVQEEASDLAGSQPSSK